MKKIIITILFNLAFISVATALEDRVVAVVNDYVVTKSDLDNQVNLALRQLGQDNISAGQKRALIQKSLAELVDRELKRQYAKENGITVSNQDISMATEIILRNNNLTEEKYKEYIKGLERAALENVSDEIRWRKIIGKAIRSQVVVSNVEIDRLIESMSKAKEVVEWEFSQIFMAVDKDKTDSQVRQRIIEITENIKSGQATFSQMARTFSEDAAAARGGYMGWFSKGEILPELIDVAEKLPLGDISEPVKSNTGWHIIKLEQRRVSKPITVKPVEEVSLQIFEVLKSKDKKANKVNYKKLKSISRQKTTDEKIAKVANIFEDNSAFSSQDMGWVKLDKLTLAQKKIVAKTYIGRTSKIFEIKTGWQVMYVAGKKTTIPEKLLEYRERVKKHMTENRVDLRSRKFLRELREKAFIDVRF